MKLRTCLLLIVILLSVACKKDAATTNNKTDGTLTGKWTYAGNYLSAGGPMYFQPTTTKGQSTTFLSNGTLQSVTFAKYNTYIIKDANTLTLKGSNTQEDYFYSIKSDTLSMSSKVEICIEGCAIVLVKTH